MEKLNRIWPFFAPIIGGLLALLDILLPDSMIQNEEVKATLSHLFWLGNVCWYLGIPITVIYLIIKVQSQQALIKDVADTLDRKVTANDEWAVKETRRLQDEINKRPVAFTLPKQLDQ